MTRKTALTFILLLFVIFTAPLLAEKQQPPQSGEPEDFRIPEKNTRTLPNGLGAVLVQYGTIPKATVNVIVKTGNLHEAADQIWLADLTGRLMREGTKTMDFKKMARKAAAMGGEVGVQVAPTHTVISISVLSEFAPDAVNLLADVATNPAFPESQIERLKNDFKRELSVQKSVPQNQAMEKFAALIYPDQPYGRTYPTPEMIESYSAEKVKAFYDANFGARRTKVYVVGKFSEQPVLTAIEKAFGSWAKGPEISYPKANPVSKKQTETIERPEAPQTTILLGLPVIAPSHDDYISLSVANTLLGGFFSSRITRNIREDKGYTYSPRGALQPGYETTVWYELADVTSEHTADALREIQKEIDRLRTEAPPSEEMKGVQNYVAGVFVLQNSSSQGIINQLHYQDLHQLGDDYLSTYVGKVHAVTPEKVKQMVDQYIDPKEMTLVMVGDKKHVAAAIK